MTAAPVVDWTRYETDLRERLTGLIAAYFGIPLDEVASRLDREFADPGSLVAEAWTQLGPRTNEEILRFYQSTDAYVYDLAADHCRPERQQVWQVVLTRLARQPRRRRVLLYGDGVGTDSIELARLGLTPTYFDLPGVTSGFARFRFAEEGLSERINVIERCADIPRNAFDAVISIEVLEHVIDPMATMQDFHRALRVGGIALITESFEAVGPRFPSHLESNLQYAGRVHRMMEGLGFANTFYNRVLLNRPMEFRKISAGPGGDALRAFCRLRRGLERRWRDVVGGAAAAFTREVT